MGENQLGDHAQTTDLRVGGVHSGLDDYGRSRETMLKVRIWESEEYVLALVITGDLGRPYSNYGFRNRSSTRRPWRLREIIGDYIQTTDS